ncbi:LacI family transcriptional regulator [Pseudoxanthomonas broegbernensis]|uniref:LacI family transcriptional regulator n=1 Tax=Pseudoxanthomonas broegbernensis TaxID=83619 RepID=A0A7V8GPP7_9GAMM|nr:LacI family DNA-binding transcriptional regulator [Pseudoxanthomonas broegbernensis]KAF1687910.1 LacI family transcriptional regulator [Pseudoxanthomonas broegbernensis]MBB6064909.1 LacI family transcriptional regulator [Pseudoxanthomonas broegbernensis]
MRARIEDVAAAAGVSIKTVSRVFNREPNVREETRLKVEEAARQLKYRPNSSARSLAGRRSYLISLLYDNPSPNYVMEVIEGVLAACEQAHYGLTLRPIDFSRRGHVESVETLIAQYRPDGLVLTPPLTDDGPLLRRLREMDVRYATISAKRDNAGIGATLDERAAVADMTAHVASLGHRRIGHITGHRSHGARVWRLAGYLDGLRRSGIEADPELVVEGEFSFESGIAGARRLLDMDDPPTAIFGANDDTACGVLYEAAARGLKVPEHLSVFGFDDTPMSRQVWPSLSTVRQPSREMGRIAAQQLLNAIAGHDPARMVRVPYQLQIRHSTGPVPQG